MLTIQNLTLAHKKDLTTLIENLSFTVNPGERVALIGEEGNGKSTLLRAICGDEAIDAYIEISGRIVNTFRTNFLRRCDDTGTAHYFSAADFPGLQQEAFRFPSSCGHELQGYFYCLPYFSR